jgi:hypothetical protein
MKPVLLLIGAVLIILLMPAMLLSINDFRMTDKAEDHIVALVSPAVASDITLSQDLFDDATYNVISITSNETSDAPIAATYTAATNVLNVTGLTTDKTRRLTVTYSIAALSSYWGADTGAKVWPMFLILGVLGIIAGAVYVATRRGE